MVSHAGHSVKLFQIPDQTSFMSPWGHTSQVCYHELIKVASNLYPQKWKLSSCEKTVSQIISHNCTLPGWRGVGGDGGVFSLYLDSLHVSCVMYLLNKLIYSLSSATKLCFYCYLLLFIVIIYLSYVSNTYNYYIYLFVLSINLDFPHLDFREI